VGEIVVRLVRESDRAWAGRFLRTAGSEVVAAHGMLLGPLELPGLSRSRERIESPTTTSTRCGSTSGGGFGMRPSARAPWMSHGERSSRRSPRRATTASPFETSSNSSCGSTG